MRKLAVGWFGLASVLIASAGGCANDAPPVERVTVAAPGNRESRIEYDRPKPLPDDARLWDRDREYAPRRPTDHPTDPR